MCLKIWKETGRTAEKCVCNAGGGWQRHTQITVKQRTSCFWHYTLWYIQTTDYLAKGQSNYTLYQLFQEQNPFWSRPAVLAGTESSSIQLRLCRTLTGVTWGRSPVSSPVALPLSAALPRTKPHCCAEDVCCTLPHFSVTPRIPPSCLYLHFARLGSKLQRIQSIIIHYLLQFARWVNLHACLQDLNVCCAHKLGVFHSVICNHHQGMEDGVALRILLLDPGFLVGIV